MQYRTPRCQRDRMGVVGESVQKSSGGNSVHNFLAGDDCPERSITAGEALRRDQNIGCKAPIFDGKVASSAAHAGHHFVSDQKDALAPADFGDGLQVSGRRNHRTQCPAAYWFEDEPCRLAVCVFNRPFQLSGVLLSTVPASVGAVVVAAVAIRNAYMTELAHHGQINFPPPLVAGNRKGAESGTVIALRPAQHLVALALSD